MTQNEGIEEICPYTQRFTVDNPAPNFAANGRIITIPFQAVIPEGEAIPEPVLTWFINPATGDYTLEDALPECFANQNCMTPFDQNWIFYTSSSQEAILSRPDGSEEQILFYNNQVPYDAARNFAFIGLHDLVYNFNAYLEDEPNPQTFVQRIDPEIDTIFEPFKPPQNQRYNDLSTTIVSVQPKAYFRYSVARTTFNTGSGEGYRYYIHDRQDDEFMYFAQLLNFQELILEWHPLGESLYYRYPNDSIWYAYIPIEEEHLVLGDFPDGIWSRDGRYRASTIIMNEDDRLDRIEDGIPIQHFGIWDRTTGHTRAYCIPELETPISNLTSELFWSPDNRYIAFQFALPKELEYLSAPIRTFVLDIETGSVTEISDFAGQIVLWTQAEGGYR